MNVKITSNGKAANSTKAANSIRGEAQIAVGNICYILRPTFGALAAAEDEIGSLFDFVDRAAAGKAKLCEIIALFWHCETTDVMRNVFADDMMRVGMVGMTPTLKIILRQILQGQ